MMKSWLLALIFLATSAWAAEVNPYTAVAKKLTGMINVEKYDGIRDLMAPSLHGQFTKDKTLKYFQTVHNDRGKINEISKPSMQGYVAIFRLTCDRGDWDLRFSLDHKGLMNSFSMAQLAPLVALPERNATLFQLPFREEWYVNWGVSKADELNHNVHASQRRAMSFVIRDATDKTHQGDGTDNEDFYAYGKEILAPGNGTVVEVIDGVPDNDPGTSNPFFGLGNCVMIQHGENEYSVLAHLKPGSIRVKVDEAVKAGQVIAQCGNSGNCGEPQLHFQLQNLEVMSKASGIAPHFQNLKVTRETRSRVEKDWSPLRTDKVCPLATENGTKSADAGAKTAEPAPKAPEPAVKPKQP